MFIFAYMYIYMHINKKNIHRQSICKNEDHKTKYSNSKSFPGQAQNPLVCFPDFPA